jgi:hypothetical protein
VPPTESSQHGLKPNVHQVKWVPTDATNGVAIVTGENFFPGTTVRLGNKTYSSAADGLIIKSDHELEITAPLSAAATGGVLSGRYGEASLLQSSSVISTSGGFHLTSFRIYPLGDDMDEVIANLPILPDRDSHSATLQEIKTNLNDPIVLVNGVPIPGTPYLSQGDASPQNPDPPIQLTMFVPSTAFDKGAPLFTVTFPFSGRGWTTSLPYYTPTVKVSRMGSDQEARLLISATDPVDRLCSGWVLQLDTGVEFPLTDARCANPRTQRLSFTIPASDLKPSDPALKCVEPKAQTLSLDVPVEDIKPITALRCIDSQTPSLTLDLPAKDLTEPTRKCVDPKTHKLSLTIPAKDLDPPSIAFQCVDPKTQTVSFDYPAKDLKPYHHFLLVNRPQPTSTEPNPVARSPLIADIPKPEPPPPGPSLDKDQKVSATLNDVHPVKFTGKHLDQVTKVLFDKTELRIVSQEDKEIVISLSPLVTSKVRDEVGLQLLSEGNDPVIAKLSVTATKTPTPPAPTTPPKKGK